MAFTSGCNIHVDSGGDDTNNGGGFDPWATFATDLAATLANTAAPVVTSASYTFVTADEGHYLFSKSGTNWTPMFARIVSTSGGAATLDCSLDTCVLWNGLTPRNKVVGIATTASPTGGTWGIDYSRSTTARTTFTDAVIDGTTNTKFTSAAHPVGVNYIGNFFAWTSGTGWTVQRAEVLSVTGTTATCDKSLGTLSSTGGNGRMGGALASPGMAGSVMGSISWMTMFVLGNHTFNFTSSSNVSGGRVTLGAGNQSIVGFTTNRHFYNRDANRPIFQSNANSISLVTIGSTHSSCHNIDFENGNANTSIIAYDDGSSWGTNSLWNCKFNAVGIAAKMGDTCLMEFCWVNACTNGSSPISISANWSIIRDCVFTSNSALAINPTLLERCVFYNTALTSIIATNSRYVSHCLFHTITGSSGVIFGTAAQSVVGNIIISCTGTSFKVHDFTSLLNNNHMQALANAYYNNTADAAMPATNTGNYSPMSEKIVLTSDPITNPSGGDFSINNVAGAGALLRALAFPITFANGLTSNGLDVGPTQHGDPAASGAVRSRIFSGF